MVKWNLQLKTLISFPCLTFFISIIKILSSLLNVSIKIKRNYNTLTVSFITPFIQSLVDKYKNLTLAPKMGSVTWTKIWLCSSQHEFSTKQILFKTTIASQASLSLR